MCPIKISSVFLRSTISTDISESVAKLRFTSCVTYFSPPLSGLATTCKEKFANRKKIKLDNCSILYQFFGNKLFEIIFFWIKTLKKTEFFEFPSPENLKQDDLPPASSDFNVLLPVFARVQKIKEKCVEFTFKNFPQLRLIHHYFAFHGNIEVLGFESKVHSLLFFIKLFLRTKNKLVRPWLWKSSGYFRGKTS